MLATFAVTNSLDAGAGSLRQAVIDANAAGGADEIVFDPTLNGSLISLLSGELEITDSLSILGPGAGLLSISAGNASRVFNITDSLSNVTIEGLTITAGSVGSGLYGGGVHNLGTLTIANSILSGNQGGWGGAVASAGTLTITATTISGNSAESGAGIYSSGSLTLTSSFITANAAADNGGAIYNEGGTLTLSITELSSNTATVGAGLFVDGGTVNLTQATISTNTASSTGGGIATLGGATTITNSQVQDNVATSFSGGGIYNNGTLAIIDSTLSGNRADASSGGALFNSQSLTLTNTSITGNSATDGAGIFNNTAASLDLTAATITGNTASADGGAIYDNRGTVTLANSSISGNAAGSSGGGIVSNGGFFTISSTTIELNTATAGTGGGIINRAGGALTLTGATISGNAAPGGGGLAVESGNATIVDSVLSDNDTTGAGNGGAILNLATLSITNSTLAGNAAASGAAIRNESDLTLTGSTLSGNTAAASGGAISNTGTLSITDSILTTNSAVTNGGAIASDGTVTITRSTLSANTSSAAGGGIFNDSSLTIVESTLSGNSAVTSGGAIHNVSSDLLITGSTVSENTAGTTGGGIYGIGSAMVVRNSTISGNTAVTGAGLRRNTGSLTISNSTIASNTASGAGAGIHTTEPGGTTVLISSIVANNNGTDIAGPLGAGSTNNLIQDTGFAGGLIDGVDGNVIGVDPLLGLLADNGGPTHTHKPLAGSPALDAGINPDALTTDQRGLARVRGVAIDIGSVEANPPPVIESLSPSRGFASRGEDLTLTADNVTDPEGTVVRVDFYLDTNNNGVPDDGELLGSDADATGGYTFLYTVPMGSQAGRVTFLARAIDDESDQSEVVSTSVTVVNDSPTIDSLTLSQSTIARGQTLTLTANGVSDSDGSVAIVEFYLDANGNGFGDFGEVIGTDTNGADGYSITYHITAAAALGATTFLAIVIDNDSADTPYASAVATITDAISIGSPRGASSAGDVHRVVSVDTLGDVLVFQQGWTFENLQEKTGAPKAIDTAIIWTDPKDGLTYVAAPSDAGLLLFTRAADGTWSLRNLTTETAATGSPVRHLAQFTSIRQKIVVIAGITADGSVVAFRQSLLTTSPGVYEYLFVDISADLESQGQTTPNLTGLTSYVPSWDTWHLAGVDTDGKIQSIWINTNNPSFTKWRANNLSAITGAPAVSGQLAVTLTSWGGINLTGLDASGNLLTTWWIPRFGGQWAVSNLTTLYSGPQLVGGNLTAYTTPWGGINYVGLDAGGTVRVYWWIPRFEGQWAVSPLLPAGTPPTSIPTGALTSSASSAGTLNVYGTNVDGHVLRMAWEPGPGNVWEIEDLTTIAEEAD